MRAYGLSNISLLIAEPPRHARPLGEELHLLYHPMRAMGLSLRLAHNLARGVAQPLCDCHSLARSAAGTDQVADRRAGLGID